MDMGDVPRELLVAAASEISRNAYLDLQTYGLHSLERGSRKLVDQAKDPTNQPIVADILVEERAHLDLIRSEFGRWMDREFNVAPEDWIFGEESLDHVPHEVDLSTTDHPVVLLDMLDGSDLFKRELSNWCTAALFYLPRAGQIIGAFVVDAFGRLYYALDSVDGAFRVPVETGNREIEQRSVAIKPSPDTTLASAVLCFYGQKRNPFQTMCSHTTLLESLDPARGARILNLGGNPMMVRVAEKRVDAVINLGPGQKPHDAIPGLYIATKAGATATTTDGEPLTFAPGEGVETVTRALHRPAADENRLTYVLGANAQLAADLLAAARA